MFLKKPLIVIKTTSLIISLGADYNSVQTVTAVSKCALLYKNVLSIIIYKTKCVLFIRILFFFLQASEMNGILCK